MGFWGFRQGIPLPSPLGILLPLRASQPSQPMLHPQVPEQGLRPVQADLRRLRKQGSQGPLPGAEAPSPVPAGRSRSASPGRRRARRPAGGGPRRPPGPRSAASQAARASVGASRLEGSPSSSARAPARCRDRASRSPRSKAPWATEAVEEPQAPKEPLPAALLQAGLHQIQASSRRPLPGPSPSAR